MGDTKIRKILLSSAFILTGIFASPVWAITYEYDTLGRLTKVTYDDGSYVVYAYDDAGNRTTVNATKI